MFDSDSQGYCAGIGMFASNAAGKRVMLDLTVINGVFNLKDDIDGTAKALAAVLDHEGGTAVYEPSDDEVMLTLTLRGSKASEAGVQQLGLGEVLHLPDPGYGRSYGAVVCFLEDSRDPILQAGHGTIEATADAWHRLYRLSYGLALPGSQNLTNLEAALPALVWTSHGPMLPEYVQKAQLRLRREGVTWDAISRYPSYVDYVVKPRVQVEPGARVRLGAYLADGTLVKSRGFVDYDAGAAESSVIAGHLGTGVFVGEFCEVDAGVELKRDSIVKTYNFAHSRNREDYEQAPEPASVQNYYGASNMLVRKHHSGGVEIFPRTGTGIMLNPRNPHLVAA